MLGLLMLLRLYFKIKSHCKLLRLPVGSAWRARYTGAMSSPLIHRKLEALRRIRAQPECVSEPFWNILLMQAAAGERLSELLVKKGVFWGGSQLAPAVRRGPPRVCFQTAAQLAMASADLVYVEGYGCTDSIPLPIHHAWLLQQDGRIQDPTWERGTSYAGIPVSLGVVERSAAETGYWGLFGMHTPKWLDARLRVWNPPEPVHLDQAAAGAG